MSKEQNVKETGEILLNTILDVKDEQIRVKDVGEIGLKLSRNAENPESQRLVFSVEVLGRSHIITCSPEKDRDVAQSNFKKCIQGLASGRKIINLDGTGRKKINQAEVVDKPKKSK